MKKIYLLGLLVTGLFSNCSNEDLVGDGDSAKGNYTINATIGETTTRTSVDANFNVHWNKSDKIGVTSKTATNAPFTLVGEGGSASAQFTGTLTDAPVYAYYPYSENDASISGKALTMTLPSAYDYTADSNGPMVASYANGSLNFKHLCGLLKVTLNNIPASATKFVLEGSSAIAGKGTVTDITVANAVLALSATESEVSKTITVTLSEAAMSSKAFYFALPAGTYESLKVSLQDAESKVLHEKTASSVTITRAKAVDMPMLDASIECLKKIAKDGGTYTLASDMIFSEPLVVEKEMTLDLNGHSIKPNDSGLNKVLNTQDALVLVRRGANLTINDSGNGTGSIDCNKIASVFAAVKLTDSNDEQNEDIKNQAATLTVNNGKLIGSYYAITGNGTRHNTVMTISGGNLSGTEADGIGIYHPQAGTLTVTGGTISGVTGIEMRAGTLAVSGGTIVGTATEFKKEANGNGATITGAAVAVSQHTTNKELKAIISGGTLTGLYALYEEDLQDATVEGISMEVKTGSTLNGAVYSENCSNFISGGTFSDPSALGYLAEKANASIALDKDYTIPTLNIGTQQVVNIDLNEKTLTTNEASYTDNIKGNLKLTNGKITGGVEGMCLFANNAKLELDGITYTAPANSQGIFNEKNVQTSTLIVKNSTIKSGYYAISTNASTNPVGNTAITLENSTFSADETAFMVNIPATVTVTGCTFTGGWQGVFLRGGTTTLTNCHINLLFASNYATSGVANGTTPWGTGNNAPAAALTMGNRSTSAYDYPTTVTLVNTTFSNSGTDSGSKVATNYPAIYIDAEQKENQGVTFTYDAASQTSFSAAGVGLVVNTGAKVTQHGPTTQK